MKEHRMSEISIKNMLDDLMVEADLGTLYGNQPDFIKSLNDWFKKNNSLTEKQEYSLRKIYRNHIG